MQETERIIESIIPIEQAGQRLDRWLSSRFDYLSRNQWQKNIREGNILINNRQTKSSRILNCGDKIIYKATYEEPQVIMDYSIVYEDDYLLVVNKSGNLPCHPAGPFFKNTLWYDLQDKVGKTYLVNRLDRETSGLLILAKNPTTAKKAAEMFTQREVEKIYLVITHGKPQQKIDAKGFLFSDTQSKVRKKRAFSYNQPLDQDFETSATSFRLIGSSNGFNCFEAKLQTGRMHQIRATLNSLDQPLLGDKLYGLDEGIFIRFSQKEMTEADRKKMILTRQALHSWKLKFTHPETGQTIAITADLPSDMACFITENCPEIAIS